MKQNGSSSNCLLFLWKKERPMVFDCTQKMQWSQSVKLLQEPAIHLKDRNGMETLLTRQDNILLISVLLTKLRSAHNLVSCALSPVPLLNTSLTVSRYLIIAGFLF